MAQRQEIAENDCMFCGEEKGLGLAIMMNEALTAKHASNHNDNLIGYIDVIMKLQQPYSSYEAWAAYQFREHQVTDEHDEFLKREYASEQFGGKITMLTEYYKFHVDLPRVVEKGIERILGKYYDKKREHDYKKIKRILKQEQGLSITSVQESESSIGESMVEKKSRYSTLLDELQESKANEGNTMSDSKLLKDMCKVIEKALPTNKNDRHFEIKGSFNHLSNHQIFEEYLRRQERKIKPKLRKQEPYNPPRRINLQELLRKRGRKEIEGSRERREFQGSRGKKEFEGSRQKDNNTRQSREIKKKEKDKFIYNTNIKIEIKNAMFYSQGQNQQPPFNIGNIEYDSGTKIDTRFRKKSLINQVNYLNQDSNKKLVAEIYKSSQQDLKRRLQSNSVKQRLTTKESMNRSSSKNKKQSLSRQSTKELKKGTSGANSARKLVFANSEWTITNSKPPSRSSSASNLKKRSYSCKNGVTVGAGGLANKRNDKVVQRRPIESISKYGSSDVKTIHGEVSEADRERRAISIKQILNRKLTFKKE